jgi:RNA polymerase sigma-70 factor (ECF subfamily)
LIQHNSAVPPGEAELLSRCVSWDRAGWDLFVSRYSPFVQAEARRQLLRYRGKAAPADVEDASQEVFTQLLRNDARSLRQFRQESSLSTWLAYIVRSVCRQIAERDRGARAAQTDIAIPPPTEEDLPLEGLKEAIAGLSRRDQKLLRLFFHEGKKYREIAFELGLSVNSVGPLLSRALSAARRRLAR